MPLEITVLDAEDQPQTITVQTAIDVARVVKMHPETVRRYAAADLWPHLRYKRRLVFTDEHLKLIVASLTDAHDFPAHTRGGS